jgi:hypothetical protein
MIQLISNSDGTYAEIDLPKQNTSALLDVIWVRDSYTEPREGLFECCECEQPIDEMDLFTCLDGGDAAHVSCVQITKGS